MLFLFVHDNEVISSEPYQLMNRLFNEQCELKSNLKSDEGSSKIIAKKKLEGGTNLQSPYDPDASYGHKGTGYSVHIAETCNNKEKIEIITDYEVHGAGRSDIGKAVSVVERLDNAGLKPKTLFADGGYPSVPSALKITEQEIDFIAPVNRGPLSENIMGRDSFEYDSEGFLTKCPMGHKPIDHRMPSHNNQKGSSLHAIFDGDICRMCNQLERCPVRAPNHRNKGSKSRDTIGDFRLEITPRIILRDKMFSMQKTPEWKERYSIRAGIEATNSELKRVHGLAKLRVRRAAKVCFAIACKLIACNIKRWAKSQKASKRPLYGFLSMLKIGIRYFFRIYSDIIFSKNECHIYIFYYSFC